MTLTRGTILASLFFLLAMLIAFYAVAHFYLISRYPLSVDYIKTNLGSPTFVEQFKVEEAKKHGYSEKEIAEYLAKRNSEKYGEYANNIFLIEATIFVVSFLIGLGLIIMNPSAKKSDATLGPPVGTSHNEHASTKKPISITSFWQEISLTRLILFIVVLPAVVILLDIILSITFSKLSREIAELESRTIAYIFYFSLGIWIADYIYRLRKLILIIVLSFIALFLYRFLLSAIINPEFIGQAMINTLEEGIIVYAALSIFSIFFRYFEPRFDYAEVKNTIEFTDPITKKKYDRGTCTKCGGITIVGKERAISFLGKSSEYFCDNCNRFLRGNPLNNIFLGLTEAVSSLLFMIGVGSNMQGKTSSYSSIFLLVLFIGIYDGIKRLSFGISGVKRSFK
jgi:hypothetical protein